MSEAVLLSGQNGGSSRRQRQFVRYNRLCYVENQGRRSKPTQTLCFRPTCRQGYRQISLSPSTASVSLKKSGGFKRYLASTVQTPPNAQFSASSRKAEATSSLCILRRLLSTCVRVDALMLSRCSIAGEFNEGRIVSSGLQLRIKDFFQHSIVRLHRSIGTVGITVILAPEFKKK